MTDIKTVKIATICPNIDILPNEVSNEYMERITSLITNVEPHILAASIWDGLNRMCRKCSEMPTLEQAALEKDTRRGGLLAGGAFSHKPIKDKPEFVSSSTPECESKERLLKDLEKMRVEMLERNVFGWPNIVKDVIEIIRNIKGEA